MDELSSLYKQLEQRIENQSLELYLLQTQISVMNRFIFENEDDLYLEYLQELLETLQLNGKFDPTYNNEYIERQISEIQENISRLKNGH